MKLDLLDSSGWLECLDAGPNTVHFSPILLKLPTLLIPTIVITEVRRVALKQRTVEKADEVTQSMRTGIVVSIDEKIAIFAAELFVRYKLPLADSLIYAITLAHKATLWTQDHHFEGLPQVRYYPKIKA